jgi:hypothetical protein
MAPVSTSALAGIFFSQAPAHSFAHSLSVIWAEPSNSAKATFRGSV